MYFFYFFAFRWITPKLIRQSVLQIAKIGLNPNIYTSKLGTIKTCGKVELIIMEIEGNVTTLRTQFKSAYFIAERIIAVRWWRNKSVAWVDLPNRHNNWTAFLAARGPPWKDFSVLNSPDKTLIRCWIFSCKWIEASWTVWLSWPWERQNSWALSTKSTAWTNSLWAMYTWNVKRRKKVKRHSKVVLKKGKKVQLTQNVMTDLQVLWEFDEPFG